MGQKWAKSDPKRIIFRIIMSVYWSRNFYGKVIAAHTDAPNDLFFGRNVPWGIYHNFKSGFWEIFSFGQDMELFMARG